MDKRSQQILDVMGITVWEMRDPVVSAEDQAQLISSPISSSSSTINHSTQADGRSPSELDVDVAPAVLSKARKIDVSMMSWDELQASVTACQACSLSTTRSQTVFGYGDLKADLMIIGEAPGAEEDRQGLPFVGKAGLLLTEMLYAIGFTREQVYIANTLKCRPPNNRDPEATEESNCEPYLLRQIELLQPKVILALGRVAAHNILQTKENLSKLRGQGFQYKQTKIPVYVSYHPAYLLRAPQEKSQAWLDLKIISDLLKH